MSKEDKAQQLEEFFIGIRDEWRLHKNTANRIGTALLELLHFSNTGEFDDIIFKRVLNKPKFLEGLISLGTIILGEYVAGLKGGIITPDGTAELKELWVREYAKFSDIIFKRVLNKPKFLEGLISLGTIILGEYVAGLKGGIITPEGAAELKELWVREYAKFGDGAKHYDDSLKAIPAIEVLGDAVFADSLSSPDFVSAFFGGNGWSIKKKEVVNAAGVVEYKYHLEIDSATIRNTLRVYEMIVSQLLGENANRFFSDMMKVDHYDPKTHRVMLDTEGGKLYNSLRPGDIIMVQQYNGNPSAENDWYVTKAYEFRVTAVGVGNLNDGEDRLDWLEFDNFVSEMEGMTPAKAFKKGDTLVRCDNDRNPNRKGLVTVMAVGENTPYMDILYGMKTDPKHALKGRIGNLEGIRTDLFGWLEGFGAYINNLYGVGKFFNYQTGESLTASMQMTREVFKRVYTETTYNVSDENNFLKNGSFQHDLEGWDKCTTSGDVAPADSGTEMLGINEGGGATPLLINGQPMSVSNKVTAQTEVKDGIRVLHLYGMGIAQDFSLIRANGTHEVMSSSDTSNDRTTSVPDQLFMGIRILPVTAGHLSVRFLKSSGGYTGWEKDITSALDWVTYQANDNSDDPWKYSGNGKLVVSYTGECYIRLIALTTDAISNSWEQYATKFEQNARRITISASKQSADLTEAVAEINIEFDNIRSTVTNNKDAADRAFANIISDLNAEIASRESLEGVYYATWVYQNDHLLSLMAGEFNSDGTIKGYADLKVQVSGISTTVTDNKSAADKAFKSLTDNLNAEISSRKSLENAYHATWVYQNDHLLSLMAGEFNSDGKIKGYADLKVQVSGISTTVTDNKTAADKAFKSLTDNLNAEISSRKSLENAYHATWVYQNDHLLSLMAGEFNSDGKIKGYADLKVQVNNIGSTVTSNKSAADKALKNLGDSLANLWDYAGDIDDEQGASATWINQNKNKWQAVAASFNDNGTVKATGSVGLYVSNKLSTFTVDADRINFKTGNFKITNKSGQTTLAFDADGNLSIRGNLATGCVIGDLNIDESGNIVGSGSIVTNNVVVGYKTQEISVPSANNSVTDISCASGMFVFLKGSTSANDHFFRLPSLSDIKSVLGITSTNRFFSARMIIINQSNAGGCYLSYRDGYGATTNQPWKMTFDDTHRTGGDAITHLAQGDYIEILLIYNPTKGEYRAYEVVHND